MRDIERPGVGSKERDKATSTQTHTNCLDSRYHILKKYNAGHGEVPLAQYSATHLCSR